MANTGEMIIPGAKLFFDISDGVGPPVVLLHGLASDRRSWDLVWTDLTSAGPAVRYDLRDFGQSISLDRAPFRHSRDLKSLLDGLGIDRCDVVGVSLGGSVALNFALDCPSRVRRLTLISPGITAWNWSDEWRARWQPMVRAARSGDVALARTLWWNHPLFATARACPEAASRLWASVQAYSGLVWAEPSREEPALPDVDRLPFLSTPTLLLTGANDLSDFRLIADIIEASAPSVERIDYEASGHLLHLERPQEIAAAINQFLTRDKRPVNKP